jgi:hypothetical protein
MGPRASGVVHTFVHLHAVAQITLRSMVIYTSNSAAPEVASDVAEERIRQFVKR